MSSCNPASTPHCLGLHIEDIPTDPDVDPVLQTCLQSIMGSLTWLNYSTSHALCHHKFSLPMQPASFDWHLNAAKCILSYLCRTARCCIAFSSKSTNTLQFLIGSHPPNLTLVCLWMPTEVHKMPLPPFSSTPAPQISILSTHTLFGYVKFHSISGPCLVNIAMGSCKAKIKSAVNATKAMPLHHILTALTQGHLPHTHFQ